VLFFAEMMPFLLAFLLAQVANSPKPSLPAFKDFPVSDVFHGTPAQPILKTDNPRKFRTRIGEAAKQGPNFAGHYTIARWRCGSDCISFVVVDAAKGGVYDAPFPFFLYILPGYDFANSWDGALSFQIDSRLLILKGCPDDTCSTYFYEWTGITFQLLRKVAAQVYRH
jgi:hypothetical protein